jgi:N-methylhydantoinase B
MVLIPKGGRPKRFSRISVRPLKRDDVVRFITGSGGGYGNPKERDPDLVLNDVLDGYITLKEAREIYGVAIDPKKMVIKEAETRRLRGG